MTKTVEQYQNSVQRIKKQLKKDIFAVLNNEDFRDEQNIRKNWNINDYSVMLLSVDSMIKLYDELLDAYDEQKEQDADRERRTLGRPCTWDDVCKWIKEELQESNYGQADVDDGCVRYDRDYDDVDSLDFTEKEYADFEAKINEAYFETDRIEAYPSWDCGGYNYWNVRMEEPNRVYIVIRAKVPGYLPSSDEIDEGYFEIASLLAA